MSKFKNSKNIIFLIFASLFVFFNLFIVILIIRSEYTEVQDAGASASSKLNLTLLSPSDLLNKPAGTAFSIGLSTISSEGSSTAEIVLSYNPAIVQGVSILESSSLIALNKNVDNANGRITVDIAKVGSGGFSDGVNLLTFSFTLKNPNLGATAVSVAPESTLGIPNLLPSSGYTSVQLSFVPLNTCGDGNVAGGEACDSGSSNGVVCTPVYGSSCQYCNNSCQFTTVVGPSCSDSIVNGSEQCDDGNLDNGDGCSNVCTTESIGNPVENEPPVTPPVVTEPNQNNNQDNNSDKVIPDSEDNNSVEEPITTEEPTENEDEDTVTNEPTPNLNNDSESNTVKESSDNRPLLLIFLALTITGIGILVYLLIRISRSSKSSIVTQTPNYDNLPPLS